jgi:hypothetical protein
MAEIREGKGVKAIAFYLPQFYPIPENDRAWGEGFTEWTNVRRARPLFPGHDQPRMPENGNYYSLADGGVRRWQAQLALENGVFGFCYYHYWFAGGKRLLEMPAERMLKDLDVRIPFCFSWANENWSRRWDGGGKELIVRQDYGGMDEWRAHFDYLLPFFRDSRYITLDGRPLLLIYKPEEIQCLKDMLACWQQRAKEAGFPGLCLMIQSPGWYFDPAFDMSGFSCQIRFQPFFSMVWERKNLRLLRIAKALYRACRALGLKKGMDRMLAGRRERRQSAGNGRQIRLDYDAFWETTLALPADPRMAAGACPDWDNTPRTASGYMLLGASPEKFERYMTRLCQKILREDALPLVFLNAWNEWGEGAYLEPDERYHGAYLRALKKALQEAERNG